jgi:pimeloyl-ACP methyl ester carboxylesterase
MTPQKTKSFSFFPIFLLLLASSGCAIKNPSVNSFQSTFTVHEWVNKAGEESDFQQINNFVCPITNTKTFVLLHGIYGDEDTFDKLPKILKDTYGGSSVYVMNYWSSQFLPNFQSLSELGLAFKKRIEELVDCKSPETIIIIAHSQGGLIAKEAVLAWIEKGDDRRGILEKTRLILIGTPNSFSTYAAYNNLIVNSIFAPITWVTGLFTAPFGKAFVYNRQAFDMADNIFPVGSGDRPSLFHSRFMLNHIAKWGEHFPSGVMDKDQPKTYAIVGVKNLFDDYDLSDGVVHSNTLLLGGIPADRVHHVPYRHFGGEAAVDDEHHRTFKAIKEIVSGKLEEAENPPNLDASAQKLSPYKDLPYSIITFVMEKSHPNIQLESIRLEAEKPPMSEDEPVIDEDESVIDMEYYKRELKHLKRRLNQDSSTDFATMIGKVLAFPFQLLQSLMYPVVNAAETRAGDSEPPKWEIKHVPITVLDGEHDGIIEVSNSEKSSFFGMVGTEGGRVKYTITDIDDPDDKRLPCNLNYTILWESSTNSSLPIAEKIKIQRNAVNYINVEIDNDVIKLTRVGCKQENMESGMTS